MTVAVMDLLRSVYVGKILAYDGFPPAVVVGVRLGEEDFEAHIFLDLADGSSFSLPPDIEVTLYSVDGWVPKAIREKLHLDG